METCHTRDMRRILVPSSLLLLLGIAAVGPAQGDAAGDRKRAQLAPVKRLLVVPPFFGTETLTRADAEAAAPKSDDAKPNEKLAKYIGYLRKLEAHAKTELPERTAARTPFRVVPVAELADAFKELKLTPPQLFENDGRLRGTKFAAPKPEAIRRLATQLHAEAVLLGTLDEPRRSTGKYSYDFVTGINYSPASVRSRAGYSLFLADGTEVLTRAVEALHPLSRIGDREYLLADWMEAEDIAIEEFLDEVARYTPHK